MFTLLFPPSHPTPLHWPLLLPSSQPLSHSACAPHHHHHPRAGGTSPVHCAAPQLPSRAASLGPLRSRPAHSSQLQFLVWLSLSNVELGPRQFNASPPRRAPSLLVTPPHTSRPPNIPNPTTPPHTGRCGTPPSTLPCWQRRSSSTAQQSGSSTPAGPVAGALWAAAGAACFAQRGMQRHLFLTARPRLSNSLDASSSDPLCPNTTPHSPRFTTPPTRLHTPHHLQNSATRPLCLASKCTTPRSACSYGTGYRIKLRHTRAIVDSIHSGEMEGVQYTTLPVFNLQVGWAGVGGAHVGGWVAVCWGGVGCGGGGQIVSMQVMVVGFCVQACMCDCVRAWGGGWRREGEEGGTNFGTGRWEG